MSLAGLAPMATARMMAFWMTIWILIGELNFWFETKITIYFKIINFSKLKSDLEFDRNTPIDAQPLRNLALFAQQSNQG